MSSRRLNGAILQIPFIKKQGLKPLLQSVEKPLLKVKLCKKENGKFSPALFHVVNKFTTGGRFQRQSLWPPIAMGGTLLFAPRARTKRKKRVRRPAADDPAPSFCLQNDGLEFPSFYPQLICVSKQHLFVQFARPYSLFRQAEQGLKPLLF